MWNNVAEDKEVQEERLEGTMGLFDKLLELKVIEEEDLTDTSWWEEAVLQGLAQDPIHDWVEHEKSESESTLRPDSLN